MHAFDLKAMMPDDDLLWEERESPLALEAGEVQVWRASSGVSAAEMEEFQGLLAADEVERARRMRAGVARDEFVVGRGMLRRMVGAALEKGPRTLVFGRGEHGKPEIAGLEFNVSHSEGVILIALCRDVAVGVDVEWVDETIEALDIAQASFSAEEYGRIARLPKGMRRTRGFYECWVGKEAVTKAHGGGLGVDLAAFSVPFGESEEREVRMGDEAGEEVFVRSLRISENFLAALALKRRGMAVRCLTLRQSNGSSRSDS